MFDVIESVILHIMSQWPTRNYLYAAGIALLALSVMLRILSYPIMSADYTASLSHWMDALRGSPGFTAFASPFSDYPPLYLYLLKLISNIPIFDLYAIKTLSLAFDVILAFVVAKTIKAISLREISEAGYFLIFAIVLALPSIFVNSSLWAQCDAIYATFVLLAFLCIIRDKPYAAAISYGIAASLKLQSIFFLPIFIAYYVGKRYNLSYLFIVPAIFILTIIPAWLGGGSFVDLLGTYVAQSQQFQALTLFAPSAYSFLNEDALPRSASYVLAHIGELAGVVLAALIVVVTVFVYRSDKERIPDRLAFLALFSVIAIPFVLPHMHERYFYLADIFSVIYAIIHPKRWYIPVAVVGASIFSYMPFLSGQVKLFAQLSVSMWILGLAMTFAIAVLVPRFVSLFKLKQDKYYEQIKI